jgi:hypothetical protein
MKKRFFEPSGRDTGCRAMESSLKIGERFENAVRSCSYNRNKSPENSTHYMGKKSKSGHGHLLKAQGSSTIPFWRESQ